VVGWRALAIPHELLVRHLLAPVCHRVHHRRVLGAAGSLGQGPREWLVAVGPVAGHLQRRLVIADHEYYCYFVHSRIGNLPRCCAPRTFRLPVPDRKNDPTPTNLLVCSPTSASPVHGATETDSRTFANPRTAPSLDWGSPLALTPTCNNPL